MAAAIPDKPALEGLEDKWGAAWEASGTYRFDRDAALARAGARTSSPSTPPADRVGQPAHRPRVQLHPHGPRDAVPAHARQAASSTRWAGTTTACPPSAACRTTTACAATRPCPTTRPSCRRSRAARARAARPPTRCPISRRNFIELCETLTAEDEKQFEELWRQLGLSVDWNLTYRTIGHEAQLAAQRAFLRNLARGEAYQADAPTLWDITFRTAVAQAELEDKEQPAAYHRVSFHKPDGVAPSRSRPRGPSCCRRAWRSSRIPTTSATRHLFGTTVTTPLFGVEVPVVAHHLAQKDKGSGIAMICTFGDVTDVVWWRELDLPNRTIIGADGRIIADAPEAIVDGCREGRLRGARRQDRVQRQGASGRAAARERGADRRPQADHARGEVLREGRQARSRSSRRASGTSRNGARDETLRGTARRGRQADRLHARPHARALRELGRRPHRRLAHLAPALLRRADPGLVRARRGRREGRASSCPPRTRCRSTRRRTCRPASPRQTAACRFVGELDIMDTWATSSLTPQIAGGWEHRPRAVRPRVPVLAAQPGPGHHPHLAVLDGAARRARARHDPVEERRHLGLHRRPRPQEDVEVQGQRRHARRACSTSTARTRCATGRHPSASAPTPPSTRRTRSRSRSAGGSRSRC